MLKYFIRKTKRLGITAFRIIMTVICSQIPLVRLNLSKRAKTDANTTKTPVLKN